LLQTLILYLFTIFVSWPVLFWFIGVRYRHRNRVPEGPCLVVSNHNSHLDAAVLLTMFPLRRMRHVHPVAAADYFEKSWFMRMWSMLFMNAVTIQRRPTRGRDPLQPIVDRLRRGESLIFFPEGSRGKAGVVAKFRPGIGMLVRELPGLLVVPVFLSGPERIWPRGALPVPLSIDANIGRPRTYDVNDDARGIAEQVQRDVLALAPPPPPEPGARPQPPQRIEVCSIDPEHQSLLFERLVKRLGCVGQTLAVSDPVLESDADGVREVAAPIPVGRSRTLLRLLAAVFRVGGRFGGDRFVEMLERAWVNEALEHTADTRFVVVDGSVLVDLMCGAEADFYRGVFDESGLNHLMHYLAGQKRIRAGDWWRFIRHAPEVWLLNVFNLAQPPVPDVLVHVRLPIGEVMKNLRLRGHPLQPWQNEAFFERQQDAYRHVGRIMRKRGRIEFVELDASELSADEAAERVLELCSRRQTTAPTP
jgi:1-acyl-sn-glycerol-3-phosphate acyltransferase